MKLAEFDDMALDALGHTISAFGWLMRTTGWLMIASAAFLLAVDVLFWLRMGLWDIFRTGLALHDMGIPLVTQWRGLQHVYDWIAWVPLALSLFLSGFLVVFFGEVIRGAIDWD